MRKLFDEPIENIISAMQTERSGKKVFALEVQLEKRIIQGGGTPVIEGNAAYFFCQNPEAKKISIVGDWNKWKNGVDIPERINRKSPWYYLKKEFPMDARLSYRFQPGGGESFNDPMNPNSLQEVFGNNTFLKMPGYEESTYLKAPGKNVLKGKNISLKVKGNAKVADREVQIYIPNGLKFKGEQRFLYVNDGEEAIRIGKFISVLDNLYFYEPHTPKVIVVFVPPVDRHGEYTMNPEFSKWFAQDLTRQVEMKLKIKSKSSLRAVQGSSLGGLFAAHIGLHHSDTLGNIIAQSPSFWIEDEKIIAQFAKSNLLPLRFYLHTGTINDALKESRTMLKVLQRKGYEVTYRETSESHNWANWSGKYAEIIKWVLSEP